MRQKVGRIGASLTTALEDCLRQVGSQYYFWGASTLMKTNLAGYDLLIHPRLNKGTAFTESDGTRLLCTDCCRLIL
jgi:hypothetical protein